jgi:Mg2+ and Co2+ transporter CorA
VSLQIVEFTSGTLRFLDETPAAAPADGFVWISLDRPDFDVQLPHIQAAAARIGGSMLLDVHVQDLASDVQPTAYDATSVYDLVIFRRLATALESMSSQGDENNGSNRHVIDTAHDDFSTQLENVFRRIDSRAVGFAVFDKLLVSVHPIACVTAQSYVQRLLSDIKLTVKVDPAEATTGTFRTRVPQSPADLVLRLINGMVDSYLGLRKDLSMAMERAQTELLKASPASSMWGALMEARRRLQMLQDMSEEQQDAMQEWLDTMHELPLSAYGAPAEDAQARRDQLISRLRDVMEHIDRVLHHARRLEQAAETGVQIHFSAQSQRTNVVMQTLTAVTTIFLPLNFLTGFFGMNFEFLPLIHSASGMWIIIALMLIVVWALVFYFWRKSFLAK